MILKDYFRLYLFYLILRQNKNYKKSNLKKTEIFIKIN